MTITSHIFGNMINKSVITISPTTMSSNLHLKYTKSLGERENTHQVPTQPFSVSSHVSVTSIHKHNNLLSLRCVFFFTNSLN